MPTAKARSTLPAAEIHSTAIYDHPQYYDLLFGADWKPELMFLEDCFERFAERRVRRLFEPACGTGRLLLRFAERDYAVAGNDLNAKAVEFCNARLVRHGYRPTAEVADMSDFELRRPVDAAFNTINSFRHLPTEAAARAHLRCMAAALAPGGIYVLGLHLTPTADEPTCTEETYSARRGSLTIHSRMWTIAIDRAKRVERVGLTFDVRTPSRRLRLADEMNFRCYSARQMGALIAATPELELVETFDFAYDIDEPVETNAYSEDVIYVLRKRK